MTKIIIEKTEDSIDEIANLINKMSGNETKTQRQVELEEIESKRKIKEFEISDEIIASIKKEMIEMFKKPCNRDCAFSWGKGGVRFTYENIKELGWLD